MIYDQLVTFHKKKKNQFLCRFFYNKRNVFDYRLLILKSITKII